MTQEEKDILLKYLCMALPYGVKVQDDMGRTYKLELGNAYLIDLYYENGGYVEAPIRPYLRPMSSMTEEEKKEMKTALSPRGTAMFEADGIHTPMTHIGELFPYSFLVKVQDWLLEHHFDFMGLIPMDAAIEITEDNNPYKI